MSGAWGIVRGPEPVASGGRDAKGWTFTLERDAEQRRLLVWISGTAMATASEFLVPSVLEARETEGRSAVEDVLDWCEPPTEISCYDAGVNRTGGRSEASAASPPDPPSGLPAAGRPETSERDGPLVFVSYSHADKVVARRLATLLEERGCAVWIDDNELAIGDSLIEQIARAIEGIEFFVVLISPASVGSAWCQKEVSLAMTGELGRVGTTVMPVRLGDTAMPSTLADKYFLALGPSDVESGADRLAADMRKRRRRIPAAPAARTRAARPHARNPAPAEATAEPIRMLGIAKEGVGAPRDDGTRGSGLYRVPLQLSRRADSRWADLFRENWNHPPAFTTMHRPGIGSVQGDQIVLAETTLKEIEDYHLQTLRLVMDRTNEQHAQSLAREQAEQARRAALEAAHQREVDEVSDRLRFD